MLARSPRLPLRAARTDLGYQRHAICEGGAHGCCSGGDTWYTYYFILKFTAKLLSIFHEISRPLQHQLHLSHCFPPPFCSMDALRKAAVAANNLSLSKLLHDDNRSSSMIMQHANLVLDFSRQLLTLDMLSALFILARAAELPAKFVVCVLLSLRCRIHLLYALTFQLIHSYNHLIASFIYYSTLFGFGKPFGIGPDMRFGLSSDY